MGASRDFMVDVCYDTTEAAQPDLLEQVLKSLGGHPRHDFSPRTKEFDMCSNKVEVLKRLAAAEVAGELDHSLRKSVERLIIDAIFCDDERRHHGLAVGKVHSDGCDNGEEFAFDAREESVRHHGLECLNTKELANLAFDPVAIGRLADRVYRWLARRDVADYWIDALRANVISKRTR